MFFFFKERYATERIVTLFIGAVCNAIHLSLHLHLHEKELLFTPFINRRMFLEMRYVFNHILRITEILMYNSYVIFLF